MTRFFQTPPPPTFPPLVEATTDPTGWHLVATPTKSKATVSGLTSGQRCWFRVAANGTAGPGPLERPRHQSSPLTNTNVATTQRVQPPSGGNPSPKPITPVK